MVQCQWILPLTKVILWTRLPGIVKATTQFHPTDYILSTYVRQILDISQKYNDDPVQNLPIDCVPNMGQTLGAHSSKQSRHMKNCFGIRSDYSPSLKQCVFAELGHSAKDARRTGRESSIQLGGQGGLCEGGSI